MQGTNSVPRTSANIQQETMPDAASFIFASLSADVAVEKRLELIKNIATNFGERSYDALERKLSEKVFTIFAADADVRVRQTLAESLKTHPDMPRSIVLKLANDVIDVAEPVLRFSNVLTDGDLVELVKSSKSLSHRVAIAMREVISQDVCSALVDTGETEVVRTLVANQGADLTETLLIRIVDEFSGRQDVMKAMSGRKGMPIGIVTRVMEVVSHELQVQLAKEYKGL